MSATKESVAPRGEGDASERRAHQREGDKSTAPAGPSSGNATPPRIVCIDREGEPQGDLARELCELVATGRLGHVPGPGGTLLVDLGEAWRLIEERRRGAATEACTPERVRRFADDNWRELLTAALGPPVARSRFATWWPGGIEASNAGEIFTHPRCHAADPAGFLLRHLDIERADPAEQLRALMALLHTRQRGEGGGPWG